MPVSSAEPSLKKTSRRLCFVLRWGAPSLHVPISPDGFVKVSDLRKLVAFAHCTDDTIHLIVRRDAKRRFSTKMDVDGQLLVRANHGHGIPGVEVVERKLSHSDAVAYAVHVTSYEAWSLIRYEGLKRGRRGHIHFLGRAPAPEEEVAGVRRGGEVCIYVDAHKAMVDGIIFSVTPSRVIVTTGNAEGVVPMDYIVKATDRRSGAQLHPATPDTDCQVPTGRQKVGVKSLHAHDNEFAYFVWAQFGPQAQDVMMLLDTGASISILPRSLWVELQEGLKSTPQTSNVEIEVGNGARLDTDGTVRIPFLISEFEFEHVFFICKDSTVAILGNDFVVRHQIHLFMAEGWMSYCGHDMPLFNRHGARQVRKVYLAKAVVIPPMQEVEVPTYLRDRRCNTRPMMFEPDTSLFFDAKVLAPRMLLDPRDQRPRVRLFNPGRNPCELTSIDVWE